MSDKLTPEQKIAKKKRSEFLNFVKNTLRRASYRWPPRAEAERAARVARGLYRCKMCEEEGMPKIDYKRGEVQLDHIDPVIPLDYSLKLENGDFDWNTFIKRLFCDKENYQIICLDHHEIKTRNEDALRAFYNQKSKEEKKNQNGE